jgi:ribonuclease J
MSGRIPADLVFVDGTTIGVATEDAMIDRRVLAEEGTITVLAIVDLDRGTLGEPVEFFTRGFVEEPSWKENASKAIDDAVLQAAGQPTDRDAIEKLITRTLGRWLTRRHRRNPVITTIVVEE